MLRMVAEDRASPDSRDSAREPTWLPVTDVTADQHLQQQLFALGKRLVRVVMRHEGKPI